MPAMGRGSGGVAVPLGGRTCRNADPGPVSCPIRMENKRKMGAFCAAGCSHFFKTRWAERSSFPGRPRHPLGHAAGRTGQQKQGQCGRAAAPIQGRCAACRKRDPLFASHPAAPFFAVLACYAPQAPIVQPARLWYNKTQEYIATGENDLYADHHTAGHRCYRHCRTGTPAAFAACGGHGLLWDCGEGTQAAARRAGVNPMRADAICLTHLPWRPHLWLPGLCRLWGAGPHKAACAAGSGGPAGYLAAVRALTGLLPYPVKPQVLMPGRRWRWMR